MRVNFAPTRIIARNRAMGLSNEPQTSTPQPTTAPSPQTPAPKGFTTYPITSKNVAFGNNIIRFASTGIERVAAHVERLNGAAISHYLRALEDEEPIIIDAVFKRLDLCGTTLLKLTERPTEFGTVVTIYKIALIAGEKTRNALASTIKQHGQKLFDFAANSDVPIDFLKVVQAVAPEQIVRIKVPETIKNRSAFQAVAYAVLQTEKLTQAEKDDFLKGYRLRANLKRFMGELESGETEAGAPVNDYMIAHAIT